MDPSAKLPIGGPSPVPADSAARPARSEAAGESASPAFRALLDRLGEQARALATRSETVADPGQLSGAVDAARDSLHDALSLGDRLLEAYRASVQGGGEGGAS